MLILKKILKSTPTKLFYLKFDKLDESEEISMSLSSNEDSGEESEDNDKNKSNMFDDEEILDDADELGEFFF